MISWLRDLKRRRVPQVVGAYLVIGFGVLQAADLTLPRLGLPDWTVTLVLVLLLLGLPVAAVLAWAYDLTPHGMKRTGPGDPADPARGPAPHHPRVRAVAIGGVVVVAASLAAGAFLLRLPDPAPALSDGLVVVVPFRVSGGFEAAYLADGMVDLLGSKLTGEGGLRAVEPRTALAAWRAGGGDGAVDGEAAARAVAGRLGAGRVLMGAVVRTGPRLHLSARVMGTADGDELARHELHGPADSLPWLVDRFAAGLLAQVGGVDAQRLPLLEVVPLPALRAYLDGQALLRAGRFSAAVDAFERAIAEDTTFALAGTFHTIAASFTSNWTTAGVELAWRHRDRMAARDRVMLDAFLGPRYPDWTPRHELVEARARATQANPDRAEAWFLYGDHVLHDQTGATVADRLVRAERSFLTATGLDPNFGPATLHLLEIALFQGDTARARVHATAFLDAEPEGDLARYVRWYLDRLDGVPAGAPPDTVPFGALGFFAGLTAAHHGFGLDASDALIDWGLARASDAHAMVIRAAAAYQLERGRPDRSLDILRRLGASTRQLDIARVYGRLYGESGQDHATIREAVARLDRDLDTGPDRPGPDQVQAACVTGQFHAAAGRPAEARRRMGALRGVADADATAPETARYSRACAAMISAVLAVAAGDPGARDAVATLDRYHADGTAGDARLRDAATLVLAELYDRLGDLEAALDAVRRRTIAIPNVHFIAGQLRQEGRLAARLGRVEEAARAYGHYLDLRVDPEPTAAPLAAEVRAELAALGQER